jgi:hypothetical protein
LQRERNVEAVRHHLRSVDSVEVTYANGSSTAPSAQALLLVSWLARELGLEPGSALGHGQHRVEYTRDDQRVAIFLRPVEYGAVDPGTLVALKISCQSDGPRPAHDVRAPVAYHNQD